MGTGQDAPEDYAQRRAELERQINTPDGYRGDDPELIEELERLDRLLEGGALPDMSEAPPGWEWVLASNERIPKWRATVRFPLADEEVVPDEVIIPWFGFWIQKLGRNLRDLIHNAVRAGALEPLAVDTLVLWCPHGRRFKTLAGRAAHGGVQLPEDAADEHGGTPSPTSAGRTQRSRQVKPYVPREIINPEKWPEVKRIIRRCLRAKRKPTYEDIGGQITPYFEHPPKRMTVGNMIRAIRDEDAAKNRRGDQDRSDAEVTQN